MISKTSEEKNRFSLPRFRFGIAAMFAGVLVSALAVVWWKQYQLHLERQPAAKRIAVAGGRICFAEDFPIARFDQIRTKSNGVTPIGLYLEGWQGPRKARLSPIDERTLWDVSRLISLQHLSIVDTRSYRLRYEDPRLIFTRQPTITSASILPICRLRNLESLELAGLPVDDECLRAISELKSLRCLSLHNTNITDDGLRYLAQCSLEWLNLSGNYITEKGLVNLGLQQHLSVLVLNNTRVAKDAAIRRFPRAKVFCRSEMPWGDEQPQPKKTVRN